MSEPVVIPQALAKHAGYVLGHWSPRAGANWWARAYEHVEKLDQAALDRVAAAIVQWNRGNPVSPSAALRHELEEAGIRV